jgi:superfamily II DNA or RNA helicase
LLRHQDSQAMEISHPRIGDRVRVRRRMWTVTSADPYDGCRVLTLAPLDGADRTPCRVIQPFDDVDAAHHRAPRARQVGLRAWRHACRALLLGAADAASLRTAASARIDLMPYQLEPAIAILRGLGSRLLIADEVGLGKTVQAALVAGELLARRVVRRVLVVCPAGLREQWADECLSRFGLRLVILDQPGLRRARAEIPPGTNPWTTAPLAIASVDFVKRPEVLPSVLATPWDLVIVDEAHGAAGDSDRRQAVSRLCRRAVYVVLLTATPHSGDDDSFAALCALGARDDRLVVFRRSRREAGRDSGRHVHTLRVALTAAERRVHAALAALTRAIRQEPAAMSRQVWLMLALLHKRALSSAFALAASAQRRLQLLEDSGALGEEQLRLPLDDGGELDGSDAAPMWADPALRDGGRERRLLQGVIDAAQEAAGAEGKLRRLRRMLRRLREPAIVFTEYRDTLLHVRNQVAPEAVVIHGGMTREQRRRALEAFPRAGLLLATDAAGEGLNLHQHCRLVINLELPWNPMRLEQRIGRVDRIGQKRRVHAVHLVSASTGETRLLDRLSEKVGHAEARLGAPNPLGHRPHWTDEDSARLIVFRDTGSAAGNPAPTFTPAMPVTRLEPQGISEAERVRQSRSLAGGPYARSRPDRAGGDLLIAITRHRRTRARLRGRTLAFVDTRIVDAAGRPVAVRVDALQCPRHGPGGLVEVLGRPELIERLAHLPAWLEENLAAHHLFADALQRRTHALLGDADEGSTLSQPGLFDRRAELARQHDRAKEGDWAVASHERIVVAASLARVHVETPRLALLLRPDRGKAG